MTYCQTEAITNHQLADMLDCMINTPYTFGNRGSMSKARPSHTDWAAIAPYGKAPAVLASLRPSITRLVMLLRASDTPLVIEGREAPLNPNSAEALVYAITSGFGWYSAADVTIALNETERLSIWSLAGITPLALLTVPVSSVVMQLHSKKTRLRQVPKMIRGRSDSYAFTRRSIDPSGMPYVATSSMNSIGLSPQPCLDANETGAGFNSDTFHSSSGYKHHQRLAATSNQSVVFPKATIAVRWDAETEQVLSWRVSSIDLSAMADSLVTLGAGTSSKVPYVSEVYKRPSAYRGNAPGDGVDWKPSAAWYEELFGGIPKYNVGYRETTNVSGKTYQDVYAVLAEQVPSFKDMYIDLYPSSIAETIIHAAGQSLPISTEGFVYETHSGDFRFSTSKLAPGPNDLEAAMAMLRLSGLTQADEAALPKDRVLPITGGVINMFRNSAIQMASLTHDTAGANPQFEGDTDTKLQGLGVITRYLDVLQAKFDWLSEHFPDYLAEDAPYSGL